MTFEYNIQIPYLRLYKTGCIKMHVLLAKCLKILLKPKPIDDTKFSRYYLKGIHLNK
jgi:hypothetical protein